MTVELLEPAGRDTTALDKRQRALVDAAKALVVDSVQSLAGCEQMVLDIKAGEQLVHDEYDEDIANANRTHKGLTGKRKGYLDPLAEARTIAVGKGATYRRKEEDALRAKEAALRKAEFEKAEEARIAEAEALEKAGRNTEAEAVISEPIKHAPVVVASTLPRPEVRYRKNYYAEVTDKAALIRHAASFPDYERYLEGGMAALNAAARSAKTTDSHIPGVAFKFTTSA